MHHPTLFAYKRLVTTPFGLLGTEENALSFALGYTFQQCLPLLHWFLKNIGIPGVPRSSLKKASIHLQKHGESGQGITDIEIHIPRHCHVIIETKVGFPVPSLEQCQKYLGRFHKNCAHQKLAHQKLVALVQSPDDTFVNSHSQQDTEFAKRLKFFHWAELLPECVRIMMGKSASPQEKKWARFFYNFLDQEYTMMKAFSTEVWILAINTDPLWPNGMSHWDIHQKYKLWWDFKDHSVRPLYLAFRVDGKLDSICRVNGIEHGIPIIDRVPEMRNIKKDSSNWDQRNESPSTTIWHFEPPVKLGKTLRTGPGMFAKRVRCDLDLLFSCNTVQEIEVAMGKRRENKKN